MFRVTPSGIALNARNIVFATVKYCGIYFLITRKISDGALSVPFESIART